MVSSVFPTYILPFPLFVGYLFRFISEHMKGSVWEYNHFRLAVCNLSWGQTKGTHDIRLIIQTLWFWLMRYCWMWFYIVLPPSTVHRGWGLSVRPSDLSWPHLQALDSVYSWYVDPLSSSREAEIVKYCRKQRESFLRVFDKRKITRRDGRRETVPGQMW